MTCLVIAEGHSEDAARCTNLRFRTPYMTPSAPRTAQTPPNRRTSGTQHHQRCGEPQEHNTTSGAENLRNTTPPAVRRTSGTGHRIWCPLPKVREVAKTGAPPGPSPAATHPVGAWSAMPGWRPGIGCRSMKPCMFPRAGRSDRSSSSAGTGAWRQATYWGVRKIRVIAGRTRKYLLRLRRRPPVALPAFWWRHPDGQTAMGTGARSQRASVRAPHKSTTAEPSPPSAQRRTSTTTAIPAVARIIRRR